MRGRTTVTLLEPATVADSYTGDPVPDWRQPPLEHDVPASIDPMSSTEAVLTSGTVISRWVCYLPEHTVVAPSWRVRWRGEDYEIDGAVVLYEGRFEGYLRCVLKRIEG